MRVAALCGQVQWCAFILANTKNMHSVIGSEAQNKTPIEASKLALPVAKPCRVRQRSPRKRPAVPQRPDNRNSQRRGAGSSRPETQREVKPDAKHGLLC
jgi:hypothetical protein